VKLRVADFLLILLLGCSLFSCNKNGDTSLPTRSADNIRFAGKEEIAGYLYDLEKTQNDPDALLQIIRIAVDIQEYDFARNCLKKYYSSKKPSAEAFYLSGYISFMKGDYETAGNYSQKAISRGYRNFDAYNLLGRIYISQNKYDSAISTLKTSLNLYPGNAESWYYHGLALLQHKDTIKSLESLSHAISINPVHLAALSEMIAIYLKHNELEKAYDLMSKVLLKHNNLQLQKSLFNLLIEMKKITGADSLLDAMNLNLDPETRQLSFAKLYYVENVFDSAIVFADSLLSIDQNNTEAMNIKGKSLERINRFNEALDEFERIVLIDSTDIAARKEIDNLNRKIAYLRKIQQEYESRPVIKFLEPIKRTN
jgi:tetratricopeptide (TPR) repeat protein